MEMVQTKLLKHSELSTTILGRQFLYQNTILFVGSIIY